MGAISSGSRCAQRLFVTFTLHEPGGVLRPASFRFGSAANITGRVVMRFGHARTMIFGVFLLLAPRRVWGRDVEYREGTVSSGILYCCKKYHQSLYFVRGFPYGNYEEREPSTCYRHVSPEAVWHT